MSRAKFIYESLDFERGLEPIKSMGIGRDEFIKKIPWSLDLLNQPDIKIEDFISNYRGFPILIYNLGGSWQATSIMDYTGMTLSSGVALRAMKRRIDTFCRKTDDRFVENHFPGYIKENINFERGLEPKESMGVGKKAQLNKLDQETDWGFEISRGFNQAIWDIIKYNDHLIKITKLSGSDGIGSYMALNDIGEPYNNTPPLFPAPEEALKWAQKDLDQYDEGF